MKRKLFSAILFGALLTASTSGLTSCKDYDDDISNLQSQIDKLATKEELQSKAEELKGLITTAQNSASEALKVAQAAQAAADKAATAGDVAAAKEAAIKAAEQAVADLKAQLEGSMASKEDLEQAAKAAEKVVTDLQSSLVGDSGLTIDQVMAIVNDAVAKVNDDKSGLDALETRLAEVEKTLAEGGEGDLDLDKIKAELEDIEKKAQEILGTALIMVTDVDLYTAGTTTGYNTDLEFYQVKELADITFPKNGETGDQTFGFTKDNVRLFNDQLLVRVSPIDATLTPDMISLINSQGAEVSKDIVEVASVTPYTGWKPLTRSSNNNGLWVIDFKVKDNKQDDLNAVAKYKNWDGTFSDILFAVAVNNTQDVSETRRVISAYDVTLSADEPDESIYTNLWVGGWDWNVNHISNIHNRYSASENGTAIGTKDYIWKNNKPALEATDDNIADGDIRDSKPVLAVETGKDISIAFDGDPIRGFYVTLDSDRAVESGVSEINAWNSYSYVNVGKKGVNATLQEGNYGSIQITDLANMSLVGDVIGFRVFAINLDGTLVDPDGIAFYVGIKPAREVDNVNLPAATAKVKYAAPATVTKTSAQNATAAIDLTEAFSGVQFDDIVWSVADVKGYNDLPHTAPNLTDFTVTYFKDNGNVTANVTEAKTCKIQIKNPQNFIDDTEYTFTGTMKNTVSTGSAAATYDVRTITVKVTKAMPWGEVPVNVTYNALQNENLLLTASNYKGITLTTSNGVTYNSTPQDGMLDLKTFLVYSNSNNDKIGSSAEYQKYTYEVLNSKMWQDANDNNKWKNTEVTTFAYNSTPANNYISTIYSTYNDGGATKLTNFIDCSTSHSIRAKYTYGNISYALNSAKTAYVANPFNAQADQTPTVVFMSWSYDADDFTRFAATKLRKGAGTTTDPFKYIYKSYIVWTTNGATVTDCSGLFNIKAKYGFKAQFATNNFSNTSADASATIDNLYGLVTNGYLMITDAWTEANGVKNAYFQPQVSGGTITGIKQVADVAPDHEEVFVIKVVDCFNHPNTIQVPVSIVTTRPAYNTYTTDVTFEQ